MEPRQTSLAVFWIRDIFVRIRILGFVHLITDPVYALFVSDFQDANIFSHIFFCLLPVLSVVTFTSSKIKCHYEVNKQHKSRYFFTVGLLMKGSGSGSVQIVTDPDQGGQKTNGSRTLLVGINQFGSVKVIN